MVIDSKLTHKKVFNYVQVFTFILNIFMHKHEDDLRGPKHVACLNLYKNPVVLDGNMTVNLYDTPVQPVNQLGTPQVSSQLNCFIYSVSDIF